MVEIPPIPTERSLYEAALKHLARFSTTRKGLHDVLQRRVKRWGIRALHAGMSEEEVLTHELNCQRFFESIVEKMIGMGVVDDAQFSCSKARSLARTGRSRRAIQAHLQAKGIDRDTLSYALDESLGERGGETAHCAELAAALVLARKRAVGPFQRPDRPEKEKIKVLAIFARNGFSQAVASQALSMERDEAEEYIIEFRSL